MEDIRKKDYAGFLEETLTALAEMPIEGLCVIGKMKGGATFVNYYKSSMMDKILYRQWVCPICNNVYDLEWVDTEGEEEGLSVYDAALIWASRGKDEDYTFGYSEEELENAL